MHWAKELLDLLGKNGECWTQCAYAVNKKGNPCNAFAEDACKWCLVGGLRIIASVRHRVSFDIAYRSIVAKIGCCPEGFNDCAYSFNEIKKLLNSLAEDAKRVENESVA